MNNFEQLLIIFYIFTTSSNYQLQMKKDKSKVFESKEITLFPM